MTVKYLARISMLKYGIVEVEAKDENEAKEKAALRATYGTVSWVANEITDITIEEAANE